MVGCRDDDVRMRPDGGGDHGGFARRAAHDRQVQLVRGQRGQDRVAVADPQRHLDPRQGALQRGDQERREILAGGHHPQDHVAAVPLGQGRDLAPGAGQCGGDLGLCHQQGTTLCGGAKRPVLGALQQRRPSQILQRFQLTVNGGRAEAQLRRGQGQAAAVGDRAQGAQLAEGDGIMAHLKFS